MADFLTNETASSYNGVTVLSTDYNYNMYIIWAQRIHNMYLLPAFWALFLLTAIRILCPMIPLSFLFMRPSLFEVSFEANQFQLSTSIIHVVTVYLTSITFLSLRSYPFKLASLKKQKNYKL